MAAHYDAPPPMVIDPGKRYVATISTDLGDIVIELFADKAPNTVNNFVFLAREGYYDGVTFHRVIPDFMAQGGDPTGSGSGGPATSSATSSIRRSSTTGPASCRWPTPAPAPTAPSSSSPIGDTPHLDGRHTVFGRVIEGMDVVLAIPPRDPSRASEPGLAMNSVTIVEEEWIT